MLTICVVLGLNFGSEWVHAAPKLTNVINSFKLYSPFSPIFANASSGLFLTSNSSTLFTNSTSGCLKSTALSPLIISSTTTPKVPSLGHHTYTHTHTHTHKSLVKVMLFLGP
ncbi:hypothetical protein AAZX31_03G098000 [Glycine max]